MEPSSQYFHLVVPSTVVTTAPHHTPEIIPVGWSGTVAAQSRPLTIRSRVRPPSRGLIAIRPFRAHNQSFINRTYLPSTSTNFSTTVSPITPLPNVIVYRAIQHQPIRNLLWTPPVVENRRQTSSDSIAEGVLYAPPPLPIPRKEVPRMLSIGSLAGTATIRMLGVPKAVYTCRLCGRPFHDLDDLIGIYSDEGRRLQIAQKILYTLSILVNMFVCY